MLDLNSLDQKGKDVITIMLAHIAALWTIAQIDSNDKDDDIIKQVPYTQQVLAILIMLGLHSDDKNSF